ncbi:hypothetical protein [uncultured Apibacter sp.]|uniref:hypothetical protein n=1 Tax=uncultured Apibacter sp. TaxID=1778616 RepID=UPI0025D66818|nr:hypothetical protein [uncultured Apibacter sp.]
MILLYKKSSEPENAYRKVSEDTKFAISVLLLKAGISYDFIAQDKEGIYWSLFDQKNKPVYQDVYKKGTPAKLIVSSQFAGKTTVYLTARSGMEIKGVLIATQSEKLIRESSWTKNAGKENIKNIKDAAAYGDLLTLHMVTWGLNGEWVTVEIREYVDDKSYNYVAEYHTEVLNGEITLPILDSSFWHGKRKTGSYYAMVKLKGKKEYILDSGYRNYHANYLHMEDRVVFPKPKINIPKNKTATTVSIPNKKNPPGKKKYVFYYKGTKNWGKLQKQDEKGNLDFSAINSKVTEEELKANLNAIGRQNVEILKGYGEKWIKWFYEYAAGTRQVLSDDDDIENKVVNNFYTGRLSKLSFDENSKQSQKLHTYPYFQEYFKNYLEVIKILLKEKTIKEKDGKEIADIFIKQLNLNDFKPNFSIISDIYSYDYYGFMGGTQTIKVDLEIEEQFPNTYKVKTKMYIGDWYGADWGDINGGSLQDFISQCEIDWSNPVESLKRIKDFGKNYFKKHIKGDTPSLNAFFWLQHYYGCHPFESEIIYQDTNYITL